ncbi:MAG: acyltransferase family protein [Dokdonella sp.]|uniref:acyltransferase family protein n=1 Tax=Dokdonella sp. TaxID=2291710 RepID=UPI003F7E0172
MRRADPPRDGVPAHSTAPLEFVQAFRGIAALLVVLWHASIFLGPYGTGLGGRLFGSGGSMGVDLFFLISGFIMVHTTRGSDGSWRDAAVFAIKRAARIWPVWIVAAALFVLCKPEPRAFVLEPANRSWLLHSLLFVPTPGAPSDVAPIYGFPVLGVGWTLNYEMYFYAVFGASMLFARWRWHAFRLDHRHLASAAVRRRTSGNGRGLGRNGCFRWSASIRAALPRPDDQPVGAVRDRRDHRLGPWFASRDRHCARGAGPVPRRDRRRSAAVRHAMRVDHGIGQWGLSLAPLLLVYCIASKRIAIPVPRSLVWLGNISFSLYLLHPLAPAILRWVPAPSRGFAAIILMTGVSVGLAALSCALIERGLCERLKESLLRSLPARPVAGLAAES